MALVASPIQFAKGRLQNLTFYQDANGRCIARTRPRPVQDFQSNPKYDSRFRNALEFGQHARLARLIRTAFSSHLECCTDASYFNRLTGLLRVIAHTDLDSQWGERSFFKGNTSLLQDFEFNANRHFSTALKAEYSTSVNPDTGEFRLDMASFIPRKAVRAPEGTRYIQIILKAAAINQQSDTGLQEVTDLIPLSLQETGPISLSLTLPHNPGDLLILGVGILFYEEYMGIPLALRGGALTIADIGRASSKDKDAPRHHNLTLEDAKAELDRFLSSRFRGKTVAIGVSNQAPAGNYKSKLSSMLHHRWRMLLDRYRKG